MLKAESIEGACIPVLAKASPDWQHRCKKKSSKRLSLCDRAEEVVTLLNIWRHKRKFPHSQSFWSPSAKSSFKCSDGGRTDPSPDSAFTLCWPYVPCHSSYPQGAARGGCIPALQLQSSCPKDQCTPVRHHRPDTRTFFWLKYQLIGALAELTSALVINFINS